MEDMSEVTKKTIRVFYPLEEPGEALDKVVLEWLDNKISKLEERVMEFERKYGMQFEDFDKKIRGEKDISFDEEDNWIDWGDYIELLKKLKESRRDVLFQASKRH